MKRKKLLLVLLTLAIVTSLTAGTLAIYTKSVTMTSSVEAKKFAFTASGAVESDTKKLDLAPQESQNYNFVVTNHDGNTPAEVALNYTISVNYSEAAEKMPGLTATLKVLNGSKYEDVKGATVSNGKITFTSSTPANKVADHNYQITLLWADNGTQNAGQTSAGAGKVTLGKGLEVTVAAEQAV